MGSGFKYTILRVCIEQSVATVSTQGQSQVRAHNTLTNPCQLCVLLCVGGRREEIITRWVSPIHLSHQAGLSDHADRAAGRWVREFSEGPDAQILAGTPCVNVFQRRRPRVSPALPRPGATHAWSWCSPLLTSNSHRSKDVGSPAWAQVSNLAW